jgi:hypothetical protein
MMTQAGWNNYWLKMEDWRLRQHFKRVENILRKRDTSHLPEALQKAREAQLESLHRYAERSIFPRNHSKKSYTPCFIDREGRECAVAHLLMQSEQNELVQTIVQKANYAYVPQMNFPELEQWADESGLTKEEVALIQPTYGESNFSNVLPVILTVWFLGIGSSLFYWLVLIRKKEASWGIRIGLLVFVIFLLAIGLYLLSEAQNTYGYLS